MGKPSWWTTVGCVLAGIGVIIGAFGAHGLEGVLKDQYAGQTKTVAGQEIPALAKYLDDFETGAEYHLLHALAIVALGLLARHRSGWTLHLAGVCFLVGILCFSGSLYALVLTGNTKWGMVAPIGGTAFIVGWFAFAAAACPCGAAQSRVSSSESREKDS